MAKTFFCDLAGRRVTDSECCTAILAATFRELCVCMACLRGMTLAASVEIRPGLALPYLSPKVPALPTPEPAPPLTPHPAAAASSPGPEPEATAGHLATKGSGPSWEESAEAREQEALAPEICALEPEPVLCAPASEAETEAEPASEPVRPAAEPQPDPEPVRPAAEPQPDPEPETEAEPAIESEPEADSKPKPKAKRRPRIKPAPPESEAKVEPKRKPRSKPRTRPAPASALKHKGSVCEISQTVVPEPEPELELDGNPRLATLTMLLGYAVPRFPESAQLGLKFLRILWQQRAEDVSLEDLAALCGEAGLTLTKNTARDPALLIDARARELAGMEAGRADH